MLVNTEGIVLRQIKFQESDKILTIFCRRNGKIQGIAKGARKPKSALIASTQIFCYSHFIMYKGKKFYNINQGEVVNSFYSLRNDLERLAYATYVMELIETAINEEEPNEILFRLLLKTLKVLSESDGNYKKLVRAFEVKYISFIGYKPHLDNCLICKGKLAGESKFSISNGGMICSECGLKGISGINIDTETLNIMKLLLYSELDKLETIRINKRSMDKITQILKNYIMTHVDRRRFRSLDFLKSIGFERND